MYFYVWWRSIRRTEYVELLIQEIRISYIRRQNIRNIEMLRRNGNSVLFLARQPPVNHGLLIHEVSTSHTTTHHSRYNSSGRVISSSYRPLPENTQQSQQTHIHTPGGIRTHSLSRRAAEDLRLRPHGHWDRPLKGINPTKIVRNKSSGRRNIS
jgi:hypothetical protein